MENKIILNEKQVRKGKGVGLALIGNKRRISRQIVQMFKDNFPQYTEVYDVFGGGGAITLECLINGYKVHYNDINRNYIDMLFYLRDCENLFDLIVSREKFFEIKNKENKTTKDKLILLNNSFGYNTEDYIYNKEISDFKYNLAKEILKETGTPLNYKKSNTYKKAIENNADTLIRTEQLQRLQRLQQLQQLQQLQRLEITHKDYKDFSDVENSIIYLDPPYKDTYQRQYKTKEIDYKDFFDWVVKMSEKNIVILSSYSVEDERFECVYTFEKTRCTLSTGQHPDKKGKTERLFMVKKQ